jgi:hypothetical protein
MVGLGQYADAFDANEIGMDLLGQVDDQMLKVIGVSAIDDLMLAKDAYAKQRHSVGPCAFIRTVAV